MGPADLYRGLHLRLREVGGNRGGLGPWLALFGFLAIVLAAISAALVGIRSYAELPLLAEQSHHMMHELKVAMARVEALHLACPMASQDLGDETYSVAKLMLRDLEGWGLLFGTKVIEP
jgi:hypothetical protein